MLSCNNTVSFRDRWRGIHRRINGQEWKRKHEEWHGVLEEGFQKVDKWKNFPSKFRRIQERCPRPNTVAVLCIQKFSDIVLVLLCKKSQWILVKLRINITSVFRSCSNCPYRCTTWAIFVTSESTLEKLILNLIAPMQLPIRSTK